MNTQGGAGTAVGLTHDVLQTLKSDPTSRQPDLLSPDKKFKTGCCNDSVIVDCQVSERITFSEPTTKLNRCHLDFNNGSCTAETVDDTRLHNMLMLTCHIVLKKTLLKPTH